ncbi:hypothetical protein [Ralstonia pseudosolanacearum]
MSRIKVGIADDHPIVLLGATSMLKDHPDIEVLFTALLHKPAAPRGELTFTCNGPDR